MSDTYLVTVRRTVEYQTYVQAPTRHQATRQAEMFAITAPDEHWVEVDYGWNDCLDVPKVPEGVECVTADGVETS